MTREIVSAGVPQATLFRPLRHWGYSLGQFSLEEPVLRVARKILVPLLSCITPTGTSIAQSKTPEAGVPGLGLSAIARLDELARMRRSVMVGSVSSYDPTEGNDDGFSGAHSFIRKEGDGLVIAELAGPGVIYRFHTPTATTDTTEFFFDGESSPRLKLQMRDLVTGTHAPFVPPLSNYGVGGYWTYVPIPFEKSVKIVVRAKLVQFIQINYARYGLDAGIRSWQAPDAADRAVQRAREVMSMSGADISAFVAPPAATMTRHRVARILQPGSRTTLFQSDVGGRIVGVRLGPSSALSGKDRALVMRIYFDGSATPAVEAPVADLFGYAWGRPAAASLLFGTQRDTSYMYFPMPYDRRVRVEVSLDAGHAPIGLSAEFAVSPVPRRADEGRFYAYWRRENPTTKGKPFTYLHTDGRGHIVGLALQAQGLGVEGTPFFEGDERVVIDGDTTVRGTGSEDSFNGGWYDVPGRWDRTFSFPLSGSLGYSNSLSRTGGFRLFLGDAYAFNKRVDFTVEHGEDTTNSVITDYAAVTYFYSLNPPTARATDLSPAARRVTDVDHVVLNPGWVVPIASFSLRNATLAKRSEKDIGRFLSLVADSERTDFGPHGVDIVATTTAAGRYRLSVQMVNGPAQGILRLYDKDQPVGAVVDTYAPVRTKGELTYVATVSLNDGENILRFKLVGKNPASTRLGIDLMRVVLEREH